MFRAIKEWMKWRDLTPIELGYAAMAMVTFIATIIFFTSVLLKG